MMTEKEFNEYIIGDRIPDEQLPNGCVCFENIHIFWFKTSEKLPEPNRKCYGAYFPKIYSLEKDSTDIFPIIRDNIRFNDKNDDWVQAINNCIRKETKNVRV